MNDMERLKDETRRELERLKQAEKDGGSGWGYTMYLGTLGLLIAIPVVLGAYLGVWLDERSGTYGWTASLILFGVAVGAVNVYLYLRE